MPSRQSPRFCAGFTLVEMVIVMGIMGIIMLAVMSFYVPAHRSTVTQTQVSDVQANLRLAMDTMTKDILMAGFLIEDPEATPAVVNTSATGFTIQTRMVGHGFGRITSVAGNVLTISNDEMLAAFHGDPDENKASKVRLFDPLTAREIDSYAEDGSTVASVHSYEHLYNVDAVDVAISRITLNTIPVNPITAESVVILVEPAGDPNPGPPPLQTVRYEHSGGALHRIINGTTDQILATNVSGVNFAYQEADGRIRRIDITLTGQTKAVNPAQPNDPLSGIKTRSLRSSVRLRNV